MRELFADMFTSGLKTAYTIPPPGGCLQLLNADLDEQGAVKRRKGRGKLFDSLGLGGIDGLHPYKDVLYAFWEGKLYKKGATGWGTALIDTLANTAVRPTNYRTLFYFTDGTALYQSDGTSAGTKKVVPYTPQSGEPSNLLADASSPLQKCKYLAVHWWNMLIATGSEDAPDTIYVAALEKPEYFPAAQAGAYYNSVYKLPQKGHTITGVVIFYDVVVIFTDKGIFGLFGDGPVDYAIRPINEQYGCIAPDSIQLVENAVWFMANDGNVRKLTTPDSNEKYFNVSPVSDDIKPTLDKLTKTNAVATYHAGQYKISFPSDNTTLRCYIRNIDGKAAYQWTNDTNTCSCYARIGDTLYSGNIAQGLVYENGVGFDDDGSPYTFRRMTHLGAGDLVKISRLVVYFRTHQTMAHLKMNIVADDIKKPNKQTSSATLALPSDSRSELGTWILSLSKMGSSPSTPSRQIKVKVEGHFFILDITGNQAEDFEIVGFRAYGIVKQNKARKDGVTRG